MCPGPPSPPWEDGGQKRQVGARSDLPRKLPSAWPSSQANTQVIGYGAEGLVYRLVPFAHRDITPFSGHCLLTEVEVHVVLPIVPGLVLVVHDFGRDVLCHVIDS